MALIRGLGDIQTRSLLKKSPNFLHSPDHMTDAFRRKPVLLKTFKRVGWLGRTHFIHPVSSVFCLLPAQETIVLGQFKTTAIFALGLSRGLSPALRSLVQPINRGCIPLLLIVGPPLQISRCGLSTLRVRRISHPMRYQHPHAGVIGICQAGVDRPGWGVVRNPLVLEQKPWT